MLKTFWALFDKAEPPHWADEPTQRERAVEDLTVALNVVTADRLASDKVFKAYPELLGLPMYRLQGALQELAVEAGCLSIDPHFPHRLGEAGDGDVLIVEGGKLWVFDGDLFYRVS